MIDRLLCQIQPYAWGDPDLIPSLLGIAPSGEPQAEMWMGAHPGAPSRLETSGLVLGRAVAQDPVAMLGASATNDSRVGASEFPFLCKFLAAAEPLSIQVHPNQNEARAGFAREEGQGIRLDDPSRTYRDPRHKPELVVALQPFAALCGFRPVEESLRILGTLPLAELSRPGFDLLLGHLSEEGSDQRILTSTVHWLLSLPPTSIAPMVKALLELGPKELPEQLSWFASAAGYYPDDAGVLVGLLLNHVVLQPGQGIFLPAGNVHSYLSGLAIETMANSDNVVRCGLTKKNVAIQELLAIADFSPIDVPVQTPSARFHHYDTPGSEFSLRRYALGDSVDPEAGSVPCEVAGPEIVVVTEGKASIGGRDTTLVLEQGEVGFVSADEGSYQLSGDGLVWRVTVNEPVQSDPAESKTTEARIPTTG